MKKTITPTPNRPFGPIGISFYKYSAPNTDWIDVRNIKRFYFIINCYIYKFFDFDFFFEEIKN